MEFRALGNAAGNDGGNGGGKGQQEEELGQFEPVLVHQGFDAGEEIDAVGDAVADEEVGNGRHAEVAQYLDQRVDLILLAHRAHLEKGETRVHGEHHDGAEQDEQHVTTGLICFHETPKAMMANGKASTIPVRKKCYKSVRYQSHLRTICTMLVQIITHPLVIGAPTPHFGASSAGKSTHMRPLCFMRPACSPASLPKPQKKSARTAPLMAPPVS
ncbi:hypothetical protein SDC9_138682 [bioreactor metagenome]|uniref:Uncharacterized protein n=1 Tax=bioreactor metagenome TaxID=1076179 RepID=A0A645DQH5_9ZZZZ